MSHPIPQYHRLFNPLLRALKALGGSGSVKEINDKVIGSLDLPNEALERLHKHNVHGGAGARITGDRRDAAD